MRLYLLDSTPLSAYLIGRPGALALIRPWIANHEATTNVIAYAEVTEFLKSFPNFSRRRTQFRLLLREVYPLLLTYPILERYADLRRQLRRPHGPGIIGDMDTLIAATALERDLTIVTADTDFTRISSAPDDASPSLGLLPLSSGRAGGLSLTSLAE